MSKKLFALLLAALMVCGAALALADGIAVTRLRWMRPRRALSRSRRPTAKFSAPSAEETRSSAAANIAIIRNP